MSSPNYMCVQTNHTILCLLINIYSVPSFHTKNITFSRGKSKSPMYVTIFITKKSISESSQKFLNWSPVLQSRTGPRVLDVVLLGLETYIFKRESWGWVGSLCSHPSILNGIGKKVSTMNNPSQKTREKGRGKYLSFTLGL